MNLLLLLLLLLLLRRDCHRPGNGRYKGHAFTGGRGNGIILQDLTLIVYQQQEKHLVQKTDLDEFIQKEIDMRVFFSLYSCTVRGCKRLYAVVRCCTAVQQLYAAVRGCTAVRARTR